MYNRNLFLITSALFLCMNFYSYYKDVSKKSSKEISNKLINLRNVKSVDGRTYLLKNKICVFIFLDVECPISKYYTQILQKIYLKSRQNNVVFFTIFPTKYTTVTEVSVFNNKYDLTIPSILDKFQSITKNLNATVTPEVFVVNQNGEIQYSGSIDDSYFALGIRNHEPKNFYLQEAIISVIKKRKPLVPHSNAIGCEIQKKT